MRALAAFCIAVSAALHVAAWQWLLPRGETAEPAPEALVRLVLRRAEPAAPVAGATRAQERPEPVAASVPVNGSEPEPQPAPVPAAVADGAAEDAVAAWRRPGADDSSAPGDARVGADTEVARPEPRVRPDMPQPDMPQPDMPQPDMLQPAASAPVEAPAPATATAPRTRARSGPPPGLRLPPSVLRGTAAADLVIDPRDRDFLDRSRRLGMRFILFQDGALGFYLELEDDMRSAVRRTEVDSTAFSRRARDLAGVPQFDRIARSIADRYGLDPQRCRLAALVPVAVERAFRQEEARALAALGRSAGEVQALCGELTEDRSRPLRIGNALLADGGWWEVAP